MEGAAVLALEEADALGLESPALGVSCGLELSWGHSVGEANKPCGVPSLPPPFAGVRLRGVGLLPREGGSPTA